MSTPARFSPDVPRADAVADVLGEAFADYPLFAETLRDPLRRRAALPLLWRAVARQAVADDGVLDLALRDDEVAGAAIWTDTAGSEAGLVDALRHGQLRFGVAAGLRDAMGLLRLQTRVDAIHREVIGEPHLYLLALGVRDASQGRGVGGELLRRGLDRADQQHLPVYLETYLDSNVELYQHLGFLPVRVDRLGNLSCHSMVRPAR